MAADPYQLCPGMSESAMDVSRMEVRWITSSAIDPQEGRSGSFLIVHVVLKAHLNVASVYACMCRWASSCHGTYPCSLLFLLCYRKLVGKTVGELSRGESSLAAVQSRRPWPPTLPRAHYHLSYTTPQGSLHDAGSRASMAGRRTRYVGLATFWLKSVRKGHCTVWVEPPMRDWI